LVANYELSTCDGQRILIARRREQIPSPLYMLHAKILEVHSAMNKALYTL
jgi:hypothetical protein